MKNYKRYLKETHFYGRSYPVYEAIHTWNYSKEERIKFCKPKSGRCQKQKRNVTNRTHLRSNFSSLEHAAKLYFDNLRILETLMANQRLKSTGTEAVVKRVAAIFTDNPKTSIRKHSQWFISGLILLQHILKKDLELQAFKIHLIT